MNYFEGYRITSPYGNRIHPITGKLKFHTGIDIVKNHRDPIYPFVSGKVIWAKWGNAGTGYGGFGNVVSIKDKYGYEHMYAHLDEIKVKLNQEVNINTVIGLQGMTPTNKVTGSHLHYEVRKNGYGTHVDPIKYLNDYFEKEEQNKLTSWEREIGIEALNNLVKKGYINSPDYHIGNVEYNWLLFTLIDKLSDEITKINNKLDNIKKAL